MLDLHTAVHEGVIRFKDAKKDLRIWEEHGVIHIEDLMDGSYRAINRHEAARRGLAINDLTARVRERERHTHHQFDSARATQLIRLVEGVVDLCRKAKETGDPSDPAVQAERRRRARQTVLVPGYRPAC